jgi:TRAP-type C4-dicarboxylate transport system substrate-binding protein
MKRMFFFMVVPFVVLSLAFSVSAEPVTLKFATIQPAPAKVVKKVYVPWSDRVVKDSAGSLKIDMYAGGTLGRNPLVQLKLLMDGMADIAWIVGDYTPGRFPDDQVFNLPFMLMSEAEGAYVGQRVFDRGLLRGYDDIKVLNLRLTGPYYVHTTFPVGKPADLKGHKFRVAGRFHAELLQQLGATTVGMPITQVTESLSRGVIDGTLNDVQVLKLFRIGDAAKYHVLVPMGSISMLIAMNKQKYESLPTEAKSAIDKNSGEALSELFAQVVGNDEVKILDAIKKDPQHQVITPTMSNLKAWKNAVQPVTDKWKKNTPNGEKLIKAFQEELDRYRAGK